MSLFVDIEKKLGNFMLKICFDTDREVLSLLGASGCGKSMTLKCIAGIEKPDKGKIILNDQVLFDSEKKINLKPQKRLVGYLFQQYALFPNMTVWQNIECGLRDKTDSEKIISEMIKKMELEGKEKSKPSGLSGGQQQRVALARILVNRPEVLLLDEPFSALDAHLRYQTEREVADLIAEYGKTTILVSHDRDEVYRLSDKIAIMDNGHIESMGLRDEVFNNPITANGARLTGCKNISDIEVIDDTHVYSNEWGISFEVDPISKRGFDSAPDAVGLRMNEIKICHSDENCEANTYRCHVADIAENVFTYTLSLKPASLKADGVLLLEIKKHIWEKFEANDVYITIPKEKILLLHK